MKDFLLEIGVEELPARFVDNARKQLVESLQSTLKEARLSFSQVTGYSTPRRLAVVVSGLAEKQEDLQQELKGPPKNVAFAQDGKPTKAGEGFARSQGVDVADLKIREFNGADYVFVSKFSKGLAAKEVLAAELPQLITGISFAKNMRWGNYSLRYARPLRWIVALFGEEVVDFMVENVSSSRTTYGHRQLSTGPLELNNPGEYLSTLEAAYVIVDYNVRQQEILSQVQAVASSQQGQADLDQDLLVEVTNLVEYPTAFAGKFDPSFLKVPKEVLVTSMKEHQRYFPVLDDQGKLLPVFIGVRNGVDNHLDLVIEGNEKVLAARLADAKFFFDEDQKTPLDDLVKKLQNVVFQEGLGTLYEKVERVTTLSGEFARLFGFANIEQIVRTAKLAKADLTTNMVYEFPELQGIMGGEYALLAGEDAKVAQGIVEHYRPRFAHDQLPSSKGGIVVSIADKLDTLVGYFGLGKIPTGSQDPFALRRQCLGIVQILQQQGIKCSLADLIRRAISHYDGLPTGEEEIVSNLLEFFSARIKVLLQEEGYRYDTIDAVLAADSKVVPAVFARAEALHQFRQTPEFAGLLTAYQRAANLGAKGESEQIDEELFSEAETKLFVAVTEVKAKVNELISREEYPVALREIATLKEPVDSFFDEVMVMDKDEKIRENRLALLKQVASLCLGIADFQLIVVDS